MPMMKKRDKIVASFKSKGKVEISRFKGLGEMTPSQLKETTMNPASRILLKVDLPDEYYSEAQLVEDLMGKKPELRFKFIREKSEILSDTLSDIIDV